MTTSFQWWQTVKADHNRLTNWLVRQHRGEVTAANRIEQFAEQYAPPQYKWSLELIASQERQHAEWIYTLLRSRGVKPDIRRAEERYWSAVLPKIDSFQAGVAAAAHAEAMRLERIKVIAEDKDGAADIREAFQRILPDEKFHATYFRSLTGEEAFQVSAGAHKQGLALLGLTL